MSTREKGLLRAGLKALGYLEFVKLDRQEGAIHHCTLCNMDFERSKLYIHYSRKHQDVHSMIVKLIHAWGLARESEMEISDLQVQMESERYACWCGKSYARKEGLYNHRREKGHEKEKSFNEILSIQI